MSEPAAQHLPEITDRKCNGIPSVHDIENFLKAAVYRGKHGMD